ncbi:hypothetical protein HVA01_32590 [Halovibrio variabilis]|uniref:Uncharacterized protein n=1 Tax=Halovibrio variabilis TaxID=31910 RepID=A0A511UVZ2_9GAMM|nr:hypothetical protein [Halovibrio variabilis]GEN29613.1 hypothetical protein HVA01_32590 [Halovibrio variabilis]
MTKDAKHDKHDKKTHKDPDDHFDEANPMPDTHHVNPKYDDDKKSNKDDKK